MFARVVDCILKPEKRGEFNTVIHDQILPIVRKQPGFVNLIGLTSHERPDHALAITFWKTKEDADRFYLTAAPMMDHLRSLVTNEPFSEHFTVDATMFEIASAGKAA
jgi:hypothetical protein